MGAGPVKAMEGAPRGAAASAGRPGAATETGAGGGLAGVRLVYVQFGDFAEAARRIAATGEETFHAQRYSVEAVEALAAEAELVAVICVNAASPRRETLPSGVEAVALRLDLSDRRDRARLVGTLAGLRPTHAALRFPDGETLDWCLRNGVRVLPCFADSFQPRPGLRRLVDARRHRRLARLLNDPRVTRVGNHNLAASRDLARIGVDPAKIVPWDWPRTPTPDDFAPLAPRTEPPFRLLHVGSVSEAKGVGDILRAFAASPELARVARLTVAGDGAVEEMRALARELGVAERAEFLGRIPFAEVPPTMRAHDALLVCSRRDYGEGLPGSIYLGLSARLPLVLTDHPMFTQYFGSPDFGAGDAVIVPERAPEALAEALLGLLRDPARRGRMSENAGRAFARIAHPVHWAEVVERWLRDRPEDRAWLDRNALPQWGRA